MMRARVLLFLAALTLCSSPGLAQNLIRGTVTDSAGRALGGVEIIVRPLAGSVTTGTQGTFVITGIPAGLHEVLFRIPGYRPRRTQHRFGTADTLALRVVMLPGDVELPAIEVLAEQPRPMLTPKRATFERRRDALTGGKFIDDSVLRVHEHSALADVIRTITGVKIVHVRGTHRALASARSQAPTLAKGRAGKPCFMQIVIDGMRVWSMKDLEFDPVPYNIDQINVVSLQAIEIYRGAAQTPPELNVTGSDCGTIVLWTRDR